MLEGIQTSILRYAIRFFRMVIRTHTGQHNPVRVIIFEFGHLGDAILLLPLLKLLKSQRKCEITVVGGPWVGAVISLTDLSCRHVQFVHPLSWRGGINSWRKAREVIHLILHLISNSYDVCIETKGYLSTGIFAVICRASVLIGSATSRTIFPFDHRIASGRVPEAIRKMSFATPLGCDPSQLTRLYPPMKSDVSAKIVSDWLKERSILGSPIIIQPLNPWNPRDWPRERMIGLICQLLKEGASNVVLIGDGSQMVSLNDMASECGSPKVHVAGGTFGLQELAVLIQLGSLYVGCDSGPAHLAAALGSKMVILLGPAEYPRFVPYNPMAQIKVLRHEVCEWQRSNNCKQTFGANTCAYGDNICIKSITSDEVMEACRELINKDITCVRL